MNHLIAPSLLTADFTKLSDAVDLVNQSMADWIHLDVMDGVFVPNISFGFPVISAVKRLAKKPLDVHLMIIEPERYFEQFKQAGADILTIHYEASRHLHRSVHAIRELGMSPGVVLNPHTPVCLLKDIIMDVDLVLLMSVNPGFGGQKFIPQVVNKIKELKELILEKNPNVKIEIDGGVGLSNAGMLVEAGVDVLVVGNAIFSSPNPIQTIERLKLL
jgi:ribulose-phosphate 3-epimerase